MKQSPRAPAMFALAVALLSWGMAPVFIRFLRLAYDPYTQGFIRYFFGALALSAFCLMAHRKEFLALVRRPGPLLAIAVLNTVQQLTWTIGCYRAPATLAQLFIQMGVVFTILFSFLLFRDERRVIRSPLFLGGTLLSFIGVATVLTGGGHAAGSLGMGTALILLVPALCWAVYIVWVKHLVTNAHPVPVFAALSIYTTLGTGTLALAFGHPSSVFEVSPFLLSITFLSGLFPLAVAHSAFHFAQKHLGSAFSSSCNLLTPFLTYLFASVFLDDVPLTAPQWIGAITLLSGTLLVARAGQRANGTANAA